MPRIANHLLRLCAAWAALAAPAAAARLEVRAVNPFSGAVFGKARVRVLSADGKEVCRGEEGMAACDLPDGTYSIQAKLSGFGGAGSQVVLSGSTVSVEIAIRLEAPVDRWLPGTRRSEREVLVLRILRRGPADAAGTGYRVRLAAVHDTVVTTQFFAGPELKMDKLPEGIYQVTVSRGTATQGFLAIIGERCEVLTVPWDELPREIECR
jgi:hypothetical protein